MLLQDQVVKPFFKVKKFFSNVHNFLKKGLNYARLRGFFNTNVYLYKRFRSPGIPESGKVLIDCHINSEGKVFTTWVVSGMNSQTRNFRNALGLISAGSSFLFLHPETPFMQNAPSYSGREIKNQAIHFGKKSKTILGVRTGFFQPLYS